jgi:hypothetical protein
MGEMNNQTPSKDQEELPMNEIERIVANHNKEMRTDMASEIVGGTRSKAITDVITVKAIAKLLAHQKASLIAEIEEKVIGKDEEHSKGCLLSKENYKKPDNICLCSARQNNYMRAEARTKLEQLKETKQ